MDAYRYGAHIARDLHQAFDAIDRAKVNCLDIITLEPVELARRMSTQPAVAARIKNDLSRSLTADLQQTNGRHSSITTGSKRIDDALNGGLPTGRIVEIAGPSSAGKSTFCLQMCVNVQLPKECGGSAKKALFIDTEGSLSTRRLIDLLDAIWENSQNEDVHFKDIIKQAEDRILIKQCRSFSELEDLLEFTVSHGLESGDFGIVVIDSIAALGRSCEAVEQFRHTNDEAKKTAFDDDDQANDSETATADANTEAKIRKMLILRASHLYKVAGILKNFAIKHNICILIANQVSNVVSSDEGDEDRDENVLSFTSQSRFFAQVGEKRPFGSLAWSNCIDARLFIEVEQDIVDDEETKISRYLHCLKSPELENFCIPVALNASGLE